MTIGTFISIPLTPPSPSFGVMRFLVSASRIDNPDAFASGRMEVWGKAIRDILQHPIFGLGPDQFRATLHDSSTVFLHPHNGFLQAAIEWGIPGGVLFCIVLIGAGCAGLATGRRPQRSHWSDWPLADLDASYTLFGLGDDVFHFAAIRSCHRLCSDLQRTNPNTIRSRHWMITPPSVIHTSTGQDSALPGNMCVVLYGLMWSRLARWIAVRRYIGVCSARGVEGQRLYRCARAAEWQST